jgi:hypothetical protein
VNKEKRRQQRLSAKGAKHAEEDMMTEELHDLLEEDFTHKRKVEDTEPELNEAKQLRTESLE